MEQWKQIPRLRYEASSLGNVRHSIHRNILRGNIDRYGYRYVTVMCGGVTKSMKVHRLVAFAFHGFDDRQIDHINNNKLDNRPENLQYCDAKFNTQKRSKAKFKNHPNVNWHKGHKKFQVRITVEGKRIRIGEYNTEQEAISQLNQLSNV